MIKEHLHLFVKTGKHWLKNEPFQQSAIIAYYTLFSLPSLMVIIISIAGYFFDKSTVQNQIITQMGDIMGMETAKTIEGFITNAEIQENSTIAVTISIGVLIFGATGAFFQLKKAMNKIWKVRLKKSNPLMTVFNRLISLGMILVIGFMLIVSLLITTLINSMGSYIRQYAPDLTSTLLNSFNLLFSFLFITALFASIFKVLPDVKIRWKATFVGAGITTILFLIAEYGLGIYFGKSNPASVFGGASSIVLIMLWIYYACLVLFYGAEFTLQYSLFKGYKIRLTPLSEPAIIQELKALKEEEIFLKESRDALQEINREIDRQKH